MVMQESHLFHLFPGAESVKTARRETFSLLVDFQDETRMKRFDEWKQGCGYQNTKGISSARVFPSSSPSGRSRGLPPSWFVLLGTRNSGGEGRTISRWNQLCPLLAHHLLASCSSGKIAVMYWVVDGHPSLNCLYLASFKTIWDVQHLRPLGQRPPAGLSNWFSVWSCGLLLRCCYLVWTSSSLSQLGRGWPIL